MQFIKITKFGLNMTMFDYFWQVVVGNVTGMQIIKMKFIMVKNTIIKYINMTIKIGYIYAIENNFDSSTYIGLTTR